MRTFIGAFALSACAILIHSSARAETVTYTFSGTTQAGDLDGAGLFGNPNNVIAPTSITVSETFDFSKAHYVDLSSVGDGPTYVGGSNYGEPVFGSATASINGQKITIGNGFSNFVQASPDANGNPVLAAYVQDSGLTGVFAALVPLSSLAVPMTAGSLSVSPSSSGAFYYANQFGTTAVNFDIASFNVNVGGTPSAVPLPASAPLFGAALMALGAIGYGVKRKARTAEA